MYNKERKIAYLKSLEGITVDDYIVSITSLFNKTEKYEELFGKDLCDFSHQDIASMYSMFEYGSVDIYSGVNSNLKKYTAWCMNQMIVKDFTNHYILWRYF